MEEDVSNKPEDISNKTIVVLVILTVIISVLGTLTVLKEVSDMKLQTFREMPKGESSMGRVSLTIVPAEKPAESSTTGYVSLEIIPTEK